MLVKCYKNAQIVILSCGWDVFRLAMARKFLGGLINVRRLVMA